MRAKPLRIVHSEAATSFGGQENRIFKEMLAMREQGHYLEAICQPDAQLTGRLRGDGFVVHVTYQVRSIHCCLTPGCLTALQPSVITSKSSFLPSVFPPRI